MFNIEIKRLIKQKWIWIMIVVCLAVCTGISFYMKLNLPENFNGKIYSYYMTGLEGDFSYEKYARVQTEYDNMIELINNESEYKQQYFNGELSEGEYKEIKQKVDSAKYRIVTMEYILGKSNYLKEQYDKGIRAAFFDDLTAMDYMLNYRIMYAMLVTSLFIACFIMWEDRQCNVHMLISSSYLGRKKLGIVRIGVYFMLTVLLCIIVLSVEYFVKIRCMNLNGLSYAAGSITGVKYCELWSIRRYLVLRAVKITGISTIGGGMLLLIKEKVNGIKRGKKIV